MTPLDLEIAQILFERWIRPSIERREKAGTLASDEKFYALQVIFIPGTDADVRINEEVIGAARMVATDPSVRLARGSIVNLEETFDRMVGWSIRADRPDVGFATLYLFRGGWELFFNAAHNLQPAQKHLAAAREFLTVATESVQQGRLRVAADALFSATELLNNAFLLTLPSFAQGRKSHGAVSTEFFRLSPFHWFKDIYTPLVKKLPSLRITARYLSDELALEPVELQKIGSVAKEFMDWISETLSDLENHRFPDPDGHSGEP